MSHAHHSNRSSSKAVTKTVDVRKEDGGAKDVRITGSFCAWDPSGHALRKDPHGTWHAKLHLAPGRYEYRFIEDGNWCDDPRCGERTPNPFGGENCVMVVV